jgi:hypothetical protein
MQPCSRNEEYLSVILCDVPMSVSSVLSNKFNECVSSYFIVFSTFYKQGDGGKYREKNLWTLKAYLFFRFYLQTRLKECLLDTRL